MLAANSPMVLTPQEWRTAQAQHEARVLPHIDGHLGRRKENRKHPIEDFLFVYYTFSPGKLRHWLPGAGVALVRDERGCSPLSDHRFATTIETSLGLADIVDVAAFADARDRTIAFVRALLQTTRERAPHFGCFGMHEWAMVYGLGPGEQRHEQLPLRLTQAETDDVVEAADIRCTHFDAYRFFTPGAVSLNAVRPTRDTQIAFEQPACLHAGMDVYKWAYKLSPLVSSDLIFDTFVLAKEIRTLDMEASPYDVRPLGFGVVAVETPQGRAEYVRRQRGFSQRSQALRERMLEEISSALPA